MQKEPESANSKSFGLILAGFCFVYLLSGFAPGVSSKNQSSLTFHKLGFVI